MVSKNIIYVNGHFYDKETKDRIALNEGIDIVITADKDDFTKARPAGHKPETILNSKAKKKEIESDKKVKKFKKVFDAGKILYFSIPKPEVIFKVELLEDLYLFLSNKKDKDVDEGKLYSCACVVRENTNKKIKFFEEIYATSLNELYKSTYVHYFGNFGNPACNALDRFHEKENDSKANLRVYRVIG